MITTADLAGFFAAHVIWGVSEADSFHPILAFTTEDGKRGMERMVVDDLEAAVKLGRQRLEENKMDAVDGALLYDGRISTDDGKLDAVLIEMRCYLFPDSEAIIAIPYTPRSTGRFLVHRPKLLHWKDCDDFNIEAAFGAFFEGVAEHEKGAKVWNDCLDESK